MRKFPITVIASFLLIPHAVSKEPHPIREMTAVWESSYPVLPSISTAMAGMCGNEIVASDEVRAAVELLSPENHHHQWTPAIEALEQHKAVYCLQAALCHRNEDVQIQAIRALGRLESKEAVRFLLVYGDYMAVDESGSENATVHGILHREISKTLSAITGVKHMLKGQDSEGLQRALLDWTKWYVDYAKEAEQGTAQNPVKR